MATAATPKRRSHASRTAERGPERDPLSSARSRRAERLAAGLLLLALACGRAATRDPRPSIVLITVDTLRADRLGCYGGAVPTPAIDRLAAAGARFTDAATPLPETRPAHFSLLSSRHPRDHGVLSNALALPDDVVTLPELLADAGYDSAAFVGCALLDRPSGAARGFARFDTPEQPQRPADQVAPRALEWLEARGPAERARPYFLWLHLFDPHMPYEPPPDADPGRSDGNGPLVAAWPRFAWPDLLAAAEANGGDLPAPLLERALELYAGEVAYVDRWVGSVLDALAAELERDPRAEPIVVFTADHGECFGHGTYFDHSNCLYDGAVRVPLIVYAPSVAPGTEIAHQVSLLDVAPTVLRLADLEIPESFAGRDLFDPPAGEAEPAFLQHPLYRAFDVRERSRVLARLRSVAGAPTEPILGDRELLGVRDGTWKYLASADREELYHLPSDPAESRNVIAEHPDVVDRLRRALRRFRQEHPLRILDPGAIDPALRDNLEALGYL